MALLPVRVKENLEKQACKVLANGKKPITPSVKFKKYMLLSPGSNALDRALLAMLLPD